MGLLAWVLRAANWLARLAARTAIFTGQLIWSGLVKLASATRIIAVWIYQMLEAGTLLMWGHLKTGWRKSVQGGKTSAIWMGRKAASAYKFSRPHIKKGWEKSRAELVKFSNWSWNKSKVGAELTWNYTKTSRFVRKMRESSWHVVKILTFIIFSIYSIQRLDKFHNDTQARWESLPYHWLWWVGGAIAVIAVIAVLAKVTRSSSNARISGLFKGGLPMSWYLGIVGIVLCHAILAWGWLDGYVTLIGYRSFWLAHFAIAFIIFAAIFDGTHGMRQLVMLLLTIVTIAEIVEKWPVDIKLEAETPVTTVDTTPSVSNILSADVVLPVIADCESGDAGKPGTGKQFNPDGSVVTGPTQDYGKYQIHLPTHEEELKMRGIDIMTEEGNEQFARILFARNGTRDWNASRHCWESALMARKVWPLPPNDQAFNLVLTREWSSPITVPYGRELRWIPQERVSYEVMTQSGLVVEYPQSKIGEHITIPENLSSAQFRIVNRDDEPATSLRMELTLRKVK